MTNGGLGVQTPVLFPLFPSPGISVGLARDIASPNKPHLTKYFSKVEFSRKKRAQAPRVHLQKRSLQPMAGDCHPDGKPLSTTGEKREDSILQPLCFTHQGPTRLYCSFPQPKLFHEFDLNFCNSSGVTSTAFLTWLMFVKKTNEKRNK